MPLLELRSDGRDNILDSLIVAGEYVIPEVMSYCCFHDYHIRLFQSRYNPTDWEQAGLKSTLLPYHTPSQYVIILQFTCS